MHEISPHNIPLPPPSSPQPKERRHVDAAIIGSADVEDPEALAHLVVEVEGLEDIRVAI